MLLLVWQLRRICLLALLDKAATSFIPSLFSALGFEDTMLIDLCNSFLA
jgi:hypothetical protein